MLNASLAWPDRSCGLWHALLVSLLGLSEAFIIMDDDFFLTEPWTLSDFITPDGGQSLTGAWAGKGDDPESRSAPTHVKTPQL